MFEQTDTSLKSNLCPHSLRARETRTTERERETSLTSTLSPSVTARLRWGHYRKAPITVFRDVTPYSLAEIYQRFGGNCSLHFQSGRNVLRNACKISIQLPASRSRRRRFNSHRHNPLYISSIGEFERERERERESGEDVLVTEYAASHVLEHHKLILVADIPLLSEPVNLVTSTNTKTQIARS